MSWNDDDVRTALEGDKPVEAAEAVAAAAGFPGDNLSDEGREWAETHGIPSEELVESQVVRHGALVTVAMVVPFTRISTDATREVASLAATEIGTSPLTVAPCVGAPIVPSGAVLSTIFDGSVSVVTLAGMALSLTMNRRSYAPSATELVSHKTLHGELVRVPIVCQSSAPAAEYSNSTDLIPEGALGSALSVTAPRR